MGQKVNPNGLRIGINRDWSSHWYADKKQFASCVDEDVKIRGYLEPHLDKIDAGLSRVDIERIKNHVKITLFVSHPAIVIGKDSEQIKAKQLQERASYRVVQKKAIQRVMRAGAKGCKTMTKGRIGGAEIARSEEYREGVLSLHTLRQPIDYAYTPCHTTYGVIGVKVWIALPDNYKELRDRRPDEGRFNQRGGRFNGRRPNGANRGPRPAVTPAGKDEGEKKGE